MDVKNWILSKIPQPIEYAKDLISPGGPSVSRAITLLTCVCLNLECLILTIACTKGVSVTAELTIITGMLSVLIGYVYGRSKTTQEKATEGDTEKSIRSVTKVEQVNSENPEKPSSFKSSTETVQSEKK